MALEDMIRKNTPTEAYDRDKFVSYFGVYQNVRGYLKKLKENSGDYGAKQDLCGALFSNPGIAENLALERVMDYGYQFNDKETNAIVAYSKHNQDKMLEELTDEEMYKLVILLPAITGINPEHDKLAKIVNENKKIAEARQSGEGIAEYVNAKAKKFPEWFKEAYSPSDAQVFFHAFEGYAQNELLSAFVDKGTKKVDRKKVENFYKDNIKKVKEEYDKEPDGKVKKDIIDGDINPRYLALAEVLYPRKKKESKYDKNPEKEDRKKERREIGMTE